MPGGFGHTRSSTASTRTAASAQARSRALDANPIASDYLTGIDEPDPTDPSSYSPGSPEEASLVLRYLGEAWESTEGADEWTARVIVQRRGERRRR
jgi:hypothetical protein